jgi:hypothetical protein
VVVSQAGGSTPRWNPNGRELFFLTPDASMVAIPIVPGSKLKLGPSARIFQTSGIGSTFGVARDGSRFLVLLPEAGSASTTLSLIFNWQRLFDQP